MSHDASSVESLEDAIAALIAVRDYLWSVGNQNDAFTVQDALTDLLPGDHPEHQWEDEVAP